MREIQKRGKKWGRHRKTEGGMYHMEKLKSYIGIGIEAAEPIRQAETAGTADEDAWERLLCDVSAYKDKVRKNI